MRARNKSCWAVLVFMAAAAVPGLAGGASGPADLLPQVPGWKASEAPKTYGPESLFEYINGAAEAFIGYDFRELAVGQYAQTGGKGTLTADIYDMGLPRNAFGIYGAERFPESRFLPIGVQGYIEEGALNFLAGRYYVKLMAYDAGTAGEAVLKAFAAEILKKIGDAGGFPAALAAFPRRGLAANSEKFVLRNFLGLEFMKNGFLASYALGGGEFDAFVVETDSDAAAGALLKAYLDHAAKKGLPSEPAGDAVRLKDPYLKTILIGRSGRFLYGATKVADAILEAATACAAELKTGLVGN